MIQDEKQILVFGGTGHYGKKIVEKLLLKGESVKIVSRNFVKAQEILGESVEIVEGDVTNQEIIAKSLENVKAIIICLSAMSNKLFRKMKQIERDAVLEIMAQAKKANITRLIYLSGYEIREQVLQDLNIVGFGEIKLEIEYKISQSDFNWTILGCAPSMEMFFAFIRNGKMSVPGGGLKAIPSIAGEDVGEIVSQVVVRNDLSSRRLRLTGPEAFNFPEAAKRIALISGMKIKHRSIPLFVVNMVSLLSLPFVPFVRFLYQSLKLLNNFPEDLAKNVPADHKILRELFDYKPVTLDSEIKSRFN